MYSPLIAVTFVLTNRILLLPRMMGPNSESLLTTLMTTLPPAGKQALDELIVCPSLTV